MTASSRGSSSLKVGGVDVPSFLYGTAWKEERTKPLVEQALSAGFRGVDTANQRKHYHEAAVGAAVRNGLQKRSVTRDELFLQTKYTYAEGQDQRLPYDRAAGYPTQVRQSLESSLIHLGVPRVDSFLLHGPRSRRGFSDVDHEVWRTIEDLQNEGRVQLIGVSNVTAEQLATLCSFARTKPAFVQNRCYASRGWDREVRDVCRAEGVVYQGFSLLTANATEIASRTVRDIAARRASTPAQVIFRFALALGMICLTGTTDEQHMREDLAARDVELSDDEIDAIERISG